MREYEIEKDRELMTDGNAVAGMMQEIFGADMTANPAECANCGDVNEVGALLAFTQAPGIVLRCPSCEDVMLRVVQTPRGTYFEARGVARMEMTKGER